MSAEKHLSYYNLRDMFSKDGCPFCIIIEKSIFKYFDDLLYEGVNTSEIVKSLSKSKGFCKIHSKILLGFNDALGTGILYQRILDDIYHSLKNDEIKNFLNKNKDLKDIKNKFCPACINERELLERYTGVFIDFIDEFLEKLKYKDSYPLCFEHFNYISEKLFKIKSPKLKEFKEVQEKNIKNFLNKLNKLIDSYDYQHSPKKLTEAEKRVWIDVVELISGRNFDKRRIK